MHSFSSSPLTSFLPFRFVYAAKAAPAPQVVYSIDTLEEVKAPKIPDADRLIKDLEQKKEAVKKLEERAKELHDSLKKSKTLEKIRELEEKEVENGLTADQKKLLKDLRAQYEIEENKVERFELALTKIKEKIAAIQSEIERLQREIKEAGLRVNDAERRKGEIKADIDQFQEVMTALDAAAVALGDMTFSTLEEELVDEGIRNRLSNLKPQLMQLSDEYDREIKDLAKQIKTIEKEIRDIEKEITAFEKEKTKQSEEKTEMEKIAAHVGAGVKEVRKLASVVLTKREDFVTLNVLLTDLPRLHQELNDLVEALGKLAIPANLKKLDTAFFPKLAEFVKQKSDRIIAMLATLMGKLNLDPALTSELKDKLKHKLTINHAKPQESILQYLSGLTLEKTFTDIAEKLKTFDQAKFARLTARIEGFTKDWTAIRAEYEGTFKKLLEKKGEAIGHDISDRVKAIRKEHEATRFMTILETMLVYSSGTKRDEVLQKLEKDKTITVKLKRGAHDLGSFEITLDSDHVVTIPEALIKAITDENQNMVNLIDSGKYDTVPMSIEIA